MIPVQLITGFLGAGANTLQAIQSQKQMKFAAQARDQAIAQLKGIKEFNAFKATQVPTLGFNLAQQSKAQGMQQGVNALQGAGAEGVIGGVGNLLQAGNQQDLQLAAGLGELEYQRNRDEAAAQQTINKNEADRKFELGAYELSNAQAMQNAAQQNRNKAIAGIFGSLGAGALGAYKDSKFYKPQNTDENSSDQLT
jgi:hypothetical protein